MTIETDTLSSPPTTAPTDISASTTHLPRGAHKRRLQDLDSVDWNTNMAPGLRLLMPDGKFPDLSAAPKGHDGSKDPASDRHDSNETSVDEYCKRALDHFPSPHVSFPMPALEFDFRIAVTLDPVPSRADNRTKKEITTVSAGRWSGSFGNGRVMAGGYDLGQARGFRPIRIVESAFVMQTTDDPPAILEMRTRGSLSGPCDVLDTLLSPRQPKDIDPRRYGFRMFATVKSPDKRYAEIVNCGLWTASGVWSGDELIIDAYRVT